MKCPCFSNKSYKNCCKPYHLDKIAENSQILMRSRYSAYALNISDYIIKTTHKNNPSYNRDFTKWREEIESFSINTQFIGLIIYSFEEFENRATVTFRAKLVQNSKNISFSEKSTFIKNFEKWEYLNGEILPDKENLF